MKIGIGNDHAAVELKNIISEHLKERGCEVVNFGTDTSESFDYPIAGYKVGKAVANGDVDLGILICGTGVGISLAANKVEGVRAVVCSEPLSCFCIRTVSRNKALRTGIPVNTDLCSHLDSLCITLLNKIYISVQTIKMICFPIIFICFHTTVFPHQVRNI